MIITQTPFRMSFFGGGTDMESFFRENGGAVLSTTFDKYCYVNVRHLPRFFDYSTELSYSKTERVTCIEDIQHPAIRNAMKMLDIFVDVFPMDDIPLSIVGQMFQDLHCYCLRKILWAEVAKVNTVGFWKIWFNLLSKIPADFAFHG